MVADANKLRSALWNWFAIHNDFHQSLFPLFATTHNATKRNPTIAPAQKLAIIKKKVTKSMLIFNLPHDSVNNVFKCIVCIWTFLHSHPPNLSVLPTGSKLATFCSYFAKLLEFEGVRTMSGFMCVVVLTTPLYITAIFAHPYTFVFIVG